MEMMGNALINSATSATQRAAWWNGEGGGLEIKQQWPQSPSATQQEGEGGSQRELETSEEQTRDHRMQATESKRKTVIKWSASSNKVKWERFDNDVDTILNSSLAEGIDKMIKGMLTIMYMVGQDMFGKEEKQQPRGGVVKRDER